MAYTRGRRRRHRSLRAPSRTRVPLQRRRAGLTVDVDSVHRRPRVERTAKGARNIYTGRLGGDAERHFPWAWKPSELVAVRAVAIEVDHRRRRQRLRIRDRVSVCIRDRYGGDETVTCVIPGHERSGEELVTDELLVEDDELAFNYRGVCGYGSTFDYSG